MVETMVPTYTIPDSWRLPREAPEWPPYPAGVVAASPAGQIWRCAWHKTRLDDNQVAAFMEMVPLLDDIAELEKRESWSQDWATLLSVRIKLYGLDAKLRRLAAALPMQAMERYPSRKFIITMKKSREDGEPQDLYFSRIKTYEAACKEVGIPPAWVE